MQLIPRSTGMMKGASGPVAASTNLVLQCQSYGPGRCGTDARNETDQDKTQILCGWPLRMDVVALALMYGGAGDRADNLVVCGVKLLEGATQCALEPIIDCEQGKARLQSMSLRITDYRQIARRHHHHRMR